MKNIFIKKFDYYCNSFVDKRKVILFELFKKEVCEQGDQQKISALTPKKIKIAQKTPVQ